MPAILEDYHLRIGILLNFLIKPANILQGAELVLIAVNKKYRLAVPGQEVVIAILVDRCSNTDQSRDAIVRHPDLHTGPRAERESGQCHVLSGIFRREILERITYVLASAGYFFMFARRCSNTSKIESECDETGITQTRGNTKHDLVMHRPPAKRMRVTYEPDAASLADRLFQDRLELTVGCRYEQVALWVHRNSRRKYKV